MKRSTMFAAMVVLLAACGSGSGGVDVTEVRMGQPTGPNAAVYFTVTSHSTDTLVGAKTDVAASVEIHETTMGDDGTMGMQPVERVDVSEGQVLVLEPGGLHLMLIDVERFEVGDSVDVTLVWENAGETTVTAEVVAPEDAMGHEGHDG